MSLLDAETQGLVGPADIADFLGLTIETVSRQLSKLRAEQIIEITNNRHVEVKSFAALKSRCG